MKKTFSFAVSPCPNDTFIFGPLFTKKINVPFKINYVLKDVEELNNLCIQGIYDVIKVSIAVYPKVRDKYVLLSCGGAMGRGCGPIVVSKDRFDLDNLKDKKVGVPGKNTTAFFLFSRALPEFTGEILELRYDKIIPAILNGDIDAGILIHEARFTYREHGLYLISDLGRWWEEETSYPIPLGCILAKRELGDELIGEIEGQIIKSIEYAEKNLDDIWPFIKQHAKEMDDGVIKKHISTFVNEFSYDLGKEGMEAICKLCNL